MNRIIYSMHYLKNPVFNRKNSIWMPKAMLTGAKAFMNMKYAPHIMTATGIGAGIYGSKQLYDVGKTAKTLSSKGNWGAKLQDPMVQKILPTYLKTMGRSFIGLE